MSLFASRRERRLWLWTLAVLVAIYSSLGPARAVADALRERNLLRVSFAAVVILLVGAVAWQWAKRRPGWREVGVALGVAFAYLVTFARMGSPEERTHLVEYGVVAALIHQALLERARHGRRVPGPAALTVTATALLGLLDEGIQSVLPSRVFDFWDILFNALAGFMVVVARLAIAPVRRPGARLWFLWLMAGAFGWSWIMDALREFREFEMAAPIPTVAVPGYLGLAAGGVLSGVLQWLVLRRYLARAGRWVLASVGAVAAVGVVVLAVGLADADAARIAGAGLFGTIAGVVQWLVLRGEVARAGWWVPVSTAGWLATVPLVPATGPPGWAIYGAVTGAALVWLLRQPAPGRDAAQGTVS